MQYCDAVVEVAQQFRLLAGIKMNVSGLTWASPDYDLYSR